VVKEMGARGLGKVGRPDEDQVRFVRSLKKGLPAMEHYVRLRVSFLDLLRKP
jgi:hypothetical protein